MELTEISTYELPYFTIGGLARLLDLAPQTILSLIRKGDLPAQKVDGHLRFEKKEIRQWLREREEWKKKMLTFPGLAEVGTYYRRG
jgi:excisionase family DNA binding protein